MSMYNLIECSDNHSDTLGSLWQRKRDDVPDGNADLIVNNNGISILNHLNIKQLLWKKQQMLMVEIVLQKTQK